MTRADITRLLAFYGLVLGALVPWLFVLRAVARMVRP